MCHLENIVGKCFISVFIWIICFDFSVNFFVLFLFMFRLKLTRLVLV